MASSFQITLTDKLMVIPNVALTIGSILARLITGPFSSGPQATTLFKDAVFAGIRTNLSVSSSETEQWTNPTTEAGYLDLAKKQGFQPDTDVLTDGLKLFWIGPKSATKVFLYCHGGGYALSCSPGHWTWLYELQQELGRSHSVSVCVIGYTLSPYGQYPTQLRQAAESVDRLINTMGKNPNDIFVGGDSAGGNMVLGLLSHILHPHPDVSTKIQLKEPLAGAILISPWTSFRTDDDSVKRNATSDYVTASASKRWSALFLGSKPSDNYSEAIRADAAWFQNLSSCVKDILVWGGGGEVLIDSINAITKKLKDAHPRTELVIEPKVSHEDFIIARLLGYKESEGAQVIQSWIKARL